MIEKANWGKSGQARARTAAVVLALGLVGCQGFPGTAPVPGKGILAENAMPVVVGMPPAQANQTRQLNVALQIKKAGGDIFHNMSLYPASTVVGVDLHHTQVSDADLAQLAVFPNLRSVNLYNTRISDVGMTNIADLHGLQTLHLGDTQISDAGLLALEKLTNLHELGLTHTRITDQGMASLAKLTNLSELSLNGSQITDAGLKDLHSLTHLRKLVLLKTGVSKAGVQQLQRAIPDVHVYFG